MKTAMKIKAALLMLTGAVVFFSCITDAPGSDPEPGGNGSVTFRISVPAGVQPGATTRALDYSDEYAVKTIDVIVFRGERYEYTAHGIITSAPTAPDNASDATMTFRTSLVLDPAPCDLMVAANARSIIAGAYPNGIPQGTSRSNVEKALIMTMPANGWVHDPAQAGYGPMPMWGYKTDQTINESYADGTHNLTLARMVAKVDVRLVPELVDAANVANSKFQLRSVRVYNYAKSGRLIPYLDGAYDWSASPLPAFSGYTEPSLPPFATSYYADIQSDGVNESMQRSVAPSPGNPYQHLTGQIYLFEAPEGVKPASENGDYMTNPCLVIGGIYRGDTDPTYYRIDFAQKNGQEVKFLPILRNNSYTVTVSSVAGSGLHTEEDAFNSIPTNIETSVLVWNNNDISATITDGVYMLGVSQKEYSAPAKGWTESGADNALTVVTNHYKGWKASVCSDEAGNNVIADGTSDVGSWLRLSAYSGTGNYDTGDRIHLTAAATDNDAPRTAWIHIQAGSFKLVVRVVQQNRYVRIVDENDNDITELLFASKKSLIGTAPAAKTFTVKWSPADRPLNIAKTYGATALTWRNAATGTITEIPAGGSYTFTVDPAGITQDEVENDPFIGKQTRLDFTIDGIDGPSAGIDLQQTHYNLVVEGLVGGLGRMSSVAIVKTNADWSLNVTDDEPILVGNRFPDSGKANTNGNFYTYTFSGTTGEALFTFTSQQPEQFDDVEIAISGGAIAPLFARSNVVMFQSNANTRILTFAQTAEQNIETVNISCDDGNFAILDGIPANVQGMHFLWGSLVGITSQDVPFSTGQIRFWPEEYTPPAGNWVYPYKRNDNTWDPAANVPYVSAASNKGADHDAFAELFGDKGYDEAEAKGDVCRYISDKGWVEGSWRMPTTEEWRMLVVETVNSDVKYGMIPTSGNPAPGQRPVDPVVVSTTEGFKWGFFPLPDARLFGAGVLPADAVETGYLTSPGKDRLLLPATGYRLYDGGALAYVGQTGYFWSSTPANDSDSRLMWIMDNAVNPERANNRSYGFTVRCIRNYNNR